MIHIGGGMFADSELHLFLFADLLKASATDQLTIDRVDTFYYLIDSGWSPQDACMPDQKDPKVFDLAVDAMKRDRLSEAVK